MTPNETRFLDTAFLVLGAVLAFGGWRAIRKRQATADGREYEGTQAA